jgi:hypothetical protein
MNGLQWDYSLIPATTRDTGIYTWVEISHTDMVSHLTAEKSVTGGETDNCVPVSNTKYQAMKMFISGSRTT